MDLKVAVLPVEDLGAMPLTVSQQFHPSLEQDIYLARRFSAAAEAVVLCHCQVTVPAKTCQASHTLAAGDAAWPRLRRLWQQVQQLLAESKHQEAACMLYCRQTHAVTTSRLTIKGSLPVRGGGSERASGCQRTAQSC